MCGYKWVTREKLSCYGFTYTHSDDFQKRDMYSVYSLVSRLQGWGMLFVAVICGRSGSETGNFRDVVIAISFHERGLCLEGIENNNWDDYVFNLIVELQI